MPRDPPSSPDRADGWLPGVDPICYGGDYNPEQWPEEVWAQDVELMRAAGVNLVSIGIFSWALLEPREGEFDFGWLDRVFGLLHEAGIRVDLATPTASPPAWFFAAYPEARVVHRDGTVLGFGSRGMASPASPAYRRAAARIASELAGATAATRRSRCGTCTTSTACRSPSATRRRALRRSARWLQRRYGSLDALNAAWGTAFWGQHYGDVGARRRPGRRAPTAVNPAQQLDFARFSDAAAAGASSPSATPSAQHSAAPVTTNFMAGELPVHRPVAWGKEVDIVSNDHYLRPPTRAGTWGSRWPPT